MVKSGIDTHTDKCTYAHMHNHTILKRTQTGQDYKKTGPINVIGLILM